MNYFKKHWEAMFIRIAAHILIGRNVKRSAVVSGRDNKDMWYMAEKLESISDRIIDEYQKPY